MTEFTVTTADGEIIEARWDAPSTPRVAVVLCHPHPLQRGTMHAPLFAKMVPRLTDHGLAVLRFNFRGVGASSGAHGHGELEVRDVQAAIEAARLAYPDLPTAVAGWSFGAATALRWQAEHQESITYIGIAPALHTPRAAPLPALEDLPAARRRFILGDRDQFTPVADLAAYAADLGAEMRVLKGSDHFFYFREAQVAHLVAEVFG